jgi:hypothetical protein
MRRQRYRSLIRQSLHYLARPHTTIPRTPVRGPAAWRGDELAARSDWRYRFTPADIDELDRAIASARATGKPLGELTRAEFPLPSLTERVSEWVANLQYGLGVVLLSGLPVDRWSEDESKTFYWCFGLHLGRPGAQNGHGDLLGRVRDQGLRYDDPAVRGYQTTAALAFHCDLADVVGLFCLCPAKSGGASRFVSSVNVYDELLRRRPDLVDLLFEPMQLDTRGDGGINFIPVMPCRYDSGQLRTMYHGDYFRSVVSHPHARPLSSRVHELLDTYDAIASEPGRYIDVVFAAGDIQLLSNHSVMHSRTDYVDHEDPARKRDLLRLWLSLGVSASLEGHAARGREYLRLVSELVRARVRDRRRA